MDALEPRGLSRRKGRAVALAAGAAIVLVVVGVVYLRPSFLLPKSAPAAAVATPDPYISTDVVNYDFPSPTVGWALGLPRSQQGNFWVARSVDGGKHWQMRYKGLGNAMTGPHVIRFFDEKRGFVAAGTSDKVLRTTDGGATWKSFSVPDSRNSNLRFHDDKHGWMIVPPRPPTQLGRLSYVDGRADLYATDDAGDSWRRLSDAPSGMYLIASRGSSEAWLTGETAGQPRVYRSLDGGSSWQPRDIPIDAAALGRGSWTTWVILLPGVGVVVSAYCECESRSWYMFSSFDGGATWRSIPGPQDPRVPGRRFAAYQDDVNWWYVEAKTLYRSSDAGQTWTKISDQLPDGVLVPVAIDVKHAWARIASELSTTHSLATTSDAGLHWTRVKVPQAT
jgi:photosystem II stability/assembly factor-like uncharacterized protein